MNLEKILSMDGLQRLPGNVLTRDELLDDVMIYGLPYVGASSACTYLESFGSINLDPVQLPVGFSIFPKDIFKISKRWARKRFSSLALICPTINPSPRFRFVAKARLLASGYRICEPAEFCTLFLAMRSGPEFALREGHNRLIQFLY